MSAPNTDVEKQARRHRPSLLGIGAVVFFALLLLASLMIWLSDNGNVPEEEGALIDGRTGDAAPVD